MNEVMKSINEKNPDPSVSPLVSLMRKLLPRFVFILRHHLFLTNHISECYLKLVNVPVKDDSTPAIVKQKGRISYSVNPYSFDSVWRIVQLEVCVFT
jgi:hypothetical protein